MLNYSCQYKRYCGAGLHRVGEINHCWKVCVFDFMIEKK